MIKQIKTLAIVAFTVIGYNSAKAQQSDISFFHLGDYVQQSTDVSPVYIPKNSFSLAIGTGGAGVSLSNGFKTNELLTPGVNGLELDFNNLYNSLDSDYSNLNQQLTANLLNLSFKRKHGSISFFANLKQNLNWNIAKNGLISIESQTGAFTKGFLMDDQINVSAHIETGIGFTQQFLDDKLAIGVRVKYLIGLADARTEEDASIALDIDSDANTWTFNIKDAIAKTAGYKDGEDPEFSTANSGVGFDIGASYEIIPNLVIEAAVNDIGSITWKENVTEYYLDDQTDLVVDAKDFDGDENTFEALEDDITSGEKEGDSYKTSLATNSYLSASYKLANIHQFRATMFNSHTTDDDPTIALGYNIALKRTTYGVVAVKNSMGDIDYGINLATKLGPLQLYVASDNLNQILGKVEEAKRANVRVGINFVFGYNKWLKGDSDEDVN